MSKTGPRIDLVLIGCGAVSRFFYAPALKALASAENIRVRALVDPSKKNLSTLAASFPDATPCASLEEASVKPGELVVIASPPKFHTEQAIQAMHSGAAVLCEKPMAVSSKEAEKLIEASNKYNALLAVGHYKRFFPSSENIKGIIDKGALGPLKRFHIMEGGKFIWQAASDSFFRKEVTPGGIFYDIGVHVIDLLLWWLGQPEFWEYEDDAMGGQEANCILRLKYASEAGGTVRLSRDWATPNLYAFEFEKGTVSWESGQANQLKVQIDGMSSLLSGELHEHNQEFGDQFQGAVENTNPQSFIAQLQNVFRAIRGEETLRVPGQAGLDALLFIENCYNRRKLMDMPWLTEAERKRAAELATAS